MNIFIIGISLALASAMLHGVANIIDNFLTNKIVLNVKTLIFCNALFNIIFVPLIFLVAIPSLPPLHLIPFFIIIALIEVLYLYPYYRALQYHDTSVVAALFTIGKAVVPFFSFFMIHEVLSVYQYLGFFIIIIGSTIISMEKKKKYTLNKSFFFMILCSLLLSLEAVIYKYIFLNIDWATGFFWPILFSFIAVSWFLLLPKIREDIKKHFRVKRNIFFLLLEEFLTFTGSVASTYALYYIPVTIVEGIEASQPLFVLLYAIIFRKQFARFFKEKITPREIAKKITIFIGMFGGVWLILNP